MDHETLDRLLMDRALGALPPDTQEMVAAFLEHEPAAAARAREFAAVTAAAGRAMRQPTASLPPFATLRPETFDAARRRLRLFRQATSLAAALVIGIGVGTLIPRRAAAPNGPLISTSSARSIVAATGMPEAAAAGSATSGMGLWSYERLYQAARKCRKTESTHWIWDSAVSLPRPGGKS